MILNKDIFVDIIGYEGIYKVNCFGEVFSLDRPVKSRHGFSCRKGKIKKPCLMKGYYCFQFHKNGKPATVSVHRLIAIHFLANPENKPMVNHIDGVKSNNFPLNLEWSNASENGIHAYNNGLNQNNGENSNRGKLKAVEVQEIRKNGKYKSYDSIGRDYSVSGISIKNILKNKSWKQLTQIHNALKTLSK